MKNEEIIIEGLKENLHLESIGKERVRVCSYVHKKDFPKVASAILSKLQTLKWDNIEKIILEHTIIKEIELKEGIKIAYRVIGPKGFGNIITEILALAPEEGEIIAEGILRADCETWEPYFYVNTQYKCSKVECSVCGKKDWPSKMNGIYKDSGHGYYCQDKHCQERFIEDAGDPPEAPEDPIW